MPEDFSLVRKKYPSLEEVVEKLLPLQEKISSKTGEIIMADSKYYRSHGCGGGWWHKEEKLEAGIIGPKTKFPLTKEDFHNLNGILFGVVRPHEYSRDSKKFAEFDNCFMGDDFASSLRDLAYMDEPPEIPRGAVEYGCFGKIRGVQEIEEPRLKFYIGDEESIPFLEKLLPGYSYLELSDCLGKELPLNGKIKDKIEKEQWESYNNLLDAEKNYAKVNENFKKRLELVRQNDGVLNYGTHIELTEEGLEKAMHTNKLREVGGEIKELLREAKSRKYDERGNVIVKEVNPGATLTVDMKRFFSNRFQFYEI